MASDRLSCYIILKMMLTRPVPIPDEEKKLLKGLHKTFWGTTKKCENKN